MGSNVSPDKLQTAPGPTVPTAPTDRLAEDTAARIANAQPPGPPQQHAARQQAGPVPATVESQQPDILVVMKLERAVTAPCPPQHGDLMQGKISPYDSSRHPEKDGVRHCQDHEHASHGEDDARGKDEPPQERVNLEAG